MEHVPRNETEDQYRGLGKELHECPVTQKIKNSAYLGNGQMGYELHPSHALFVALHYFRQKSEGLATTPS